MVRLYHYPQTTADRVRWLLDELGVPYEPVLVDLMAGEHKKPEYLKINPNGLVPTVVDGDAVVFESVAILLHLVDKFGAGRLAPALGSDDRGQLYQWMVFTATSLDPPAFQVLLHSALLPDAHRSPALLEESRRKFNDAAAVLDRGLHGRPYIVGGAFTVADIMVAGALHRAQGLGLLADRPALRAYVEKHGARPAAPYRR
jgi:glutathione S-transferase